MQGSRTFSPKWHYIKGPRQPFGSLQCGYYVMKFMTDLMEESLLSIEAKMKELAAEKNFTMEEIDEVRLVIIAFVQRCIGKYGAEQLDV
ncbi:hypothetical protein FRX31_025099 [Thalictrum thalictroides]|uniref:Uncharacterized protein n=1 Tax=Thalictrum thalictroides TaxID=46969 RepID=A0A7J6VMC7_THATH|nr:hypothetical protein FRX31_025099 [Thalictrum thalictroides]